MNVVVTRAALAAALLFALSEAHGHGFAGKRFFPATPTTEDPFVADELSLPTITRQRFGASGDEPGSRETDFSVDMSKRITEKLGIGFGATYKQIEPDGGERQRGFDNFAASIKYQLLTDADHEAIVSAGL